MSLLKLTKYSTSTSACGPIVYEFQSSCSTGTNITSIVKKLLQFEAIITPFQSPSTSMMVLALEHHSKNKKDTTFKSIQSTILPGY